jgi:hypothetical protein
MVGVDLNASVFLVTSSNSDNQNFGSSFAFYRDYRDDVYFLTCRHVVTDVGGPDEARVENHPVERVASGSEDGLDDLAVLRVEDLPDVPLLQLSVSAEMGSSVTVAGFRGFARSFLIRQIRGKLGQQIGLEARQHPGRVMAWDLKIEDDYDLEHGHSGAPVVDERSGHVIAVASHRLGGTKGVAIAVETLESIWPSMLTEVQDSYPANAFSRALGLFGRGVPSVERVEPAVLQRFRVSSRVGFLAAATEDAPIYGGFRALAAVRADDLSEEEVRQVVDKWYACVKHVGTARAGTDRSKHGHLFFLFDFGCSEEMVRLIRQVGAIPKPGRSFESFELPLPPPPEIHISSYVVDFKEGNIHTAPATIIGPGEFSKEYLEDLLNRSTYRFFPH